MKSILIIGLGRFGRHLARRFSRLGHEVLAADRSEAAVAAIESDVTSALICDCADEHALSALGPANFDLCFVCVGSDFAASLLITTMLRDLGARRIIAKASRDLHARLLLKNGADETVYPEKDAAERMAERMSAANVFDYIELTEDHAIYEIPVPDRWIGHTLSEIGVRGRYGVNVLAVKTGEALRPLPGAEYAFTGQEHILALAAKEDARKLLRKSSRR